MARLGHLTRHLTVRLALAVVLLVGGFAGVSVLAPQLHLTPTAHAQNLSDDVLFIHGFAGGNLYGSTNTVPGGCYGDPTPAHGAKTNWAVVINYMQSQGWTGALKTIGYYGQDGTTSDYRCDITFATAAASHAYAAAAHQSKCDNYFYDASNDSTNNQDLKNLGCQFAWYVWYNYTSQHRNVRVVTHSMGGMILRWALDRVSKQDPAFPPYLYIPEVVQIAAPNWGVPAVASGDPFECPLIVNGNVVAQCQMVEDMIPNGGAPSTDPSDFINVLDGEDHSPFGSYSVPTEWTLMSGFCDQWSSGVDWTSAMNFPPAQAGMPAVHKILYADDVNQPDGTPYSACGFPPNSVHAYSHGDYLVDPQDIANTSAQLCDNCSGAPPDSARQIKSFDHSIHMVYQHISVDAPAAPGAYCYSTPNEGNCSGYTYKEQNCPDYPQSQTNTDSLGYITVTLHYSGSANCQSNWTTAQVTSTGKANGIHITQVDIERQAITQLGARTITDYPSASADITNWYSRMLWAPNSPAQGCVWYANGGSSYGPLCTGYSPIVTQCVSQPNTTNCDNQDYIQQGCNHYPQSQQYSDSNVQVILEYSTNCQSNFTWAQIKNSGDVIRQIDIERLSVPQTPAATLTDYPDATTWYTNLLWAPVAQARSCVWYGPVNSHNTIYGPFCTPYSPAVTGCASSPSDAHCDNQDYQAQGCNHYVQSGAVNGPYVTVDLEYSTNCQSNFTWAQMDTGLYVLVKVDIERASSSSDPAMTLTEYPTGNTWYTNMIWAPYNSARGCAWYAQPDIARLYGPVCSAWV